MYFVYFFFFNDTATTEIYTLSLHDALPISIGFATTVVAVSTPALAQNTLAQRVSRAPDGVVHVQFSARSGTCGDGRDRKSTRLNSSHANISYAVFCLKKKKTLQIVLS